MVGPISQIIYDFNCKLIDELIIAIGSVNHRTAIYKEFEGIKIKKPNIISSKPQ